MAPEAGYRLRVHATGRDTAPDLAVSNPVENYLIQLWSTDGDEDGPVQEYELSDRFGAGWRASNTIS